MNKKILIVALTLVAIIIVMIYFRPLKSELTQKNPNLKNNKLLSGIKVETICTDGIDNDGDGLIDSADADCWIRDGAVFTEDFEPVWTFGWLKSTLPDLQDIGVKTIETLPVWEPASVGNHFMRWGVRDYTKLDPERGTETDLSALISEAHHLGLKIMPMAETGNTVASTADCADRILVKNDFYDRGGIGGYYYNYQIAHPDENIILKDLNDKYDCIAAGWGYALNMDNPDYIEAAKVFYRDQVINRGFDGMRLDSSGRMHCVEGEVVYFTADPAICADPVEQKHSPLVLFRALKTISPPNHVFLSEAQDTEGIDTNYLNTAPYYAMNPDMDEVAEISEGYEFRWLLLDIIGGKKTSGSLTGWVNGQPIDYGRQRVRMIRNWNGIDMATLNFIASDSRYYSAVTLAATIPGVPAGSHYELFGNKEWENKQNINVINSPENRAVQWKKVLTIRNSNNALKYGNIKNVWKSGDNIFAYSRIYEDKTVIVVISFGSKTAASILNISFKPGTVLEDKLSDETFTVNDPANFRITVPAYGSRILTIKSYTL